MQLIRAAQVQPPVEKIVTGMALVTHFVLSRKADGVGKTKAVVFQHPHAHHNQRPMALLINIVLKKLPDNILNPAIFINGF